jgi:hypothetical protein
MAPRRAVFAALCALIVSIGGSASDSQVITEGLVLAETSPTAEPEASPIPENHLSSDIRNLTAQPSFLSDREVTLTLASFTFGILVIVFQVFLLKGRSFSADELLRNFAVTVILVSTLAVVSGGFDDKLVNAVIGLFGTVVGYLLGKASDGRRGPTPSPDQAASAAQKENK